MLVLGGCNSTVACGTSDKLQHIKVAAGFGEISQGHPEGGRYFILKTKSVLIPILVLKCFPPNSLEISNEIM